jgi:phosphohistidine swiveling domain-containing protein
MNDTEWVRDGPLGALPDRTSPQVLAAFEALLNLTDRHDIGGPGTPDADIASLASVFSGRLYFNRTHRRRQRSLLRPAHIVRDHAEATARHLRRLADADPRELSDFEVWAGVEQWSSEAPAYLRTALRFGRLWSVEATWRAANEPSGLPCEQVTLLSPNTGERTTGAQQLFDLAALVAIAKSEPAAVAYLASEGRSWSDMRAALRETTFLAAFERFLEQYGHRGPYEYDWARPGFREDPAPLVDALRLQLRGDTNLDFDTRIAHRRREAADAWSAFDACLSPWRRWLTRARIRRSIRTIQQHAIWRDRIRSDVVRVLAALRGWHLALADRFEERGWLAHRDDYFLLRFTEIAPIVHGQRGAGMLRAIVADRIAERARHRALRMPFVLRASELPALMETGDIGAQRSEVPSLCDDGAIVGQPMSAGSIEAPVVVLHDPGDVSRMQPGAILVAPAADPSWIAVLTLSSGLILETCGVLSQIATLARECGLPALGNVPHATARFRTGDRVRLDATQGRVHRVGATETTQVRDAPADFPRADCRHGVCPE